jgi:malonyl-CoA O-methyltransferase
LNSQTLRAAFDRIAGRYDHHAALEREAGHRLLERLAFLRREPERILDLGCGTGAAGAQLKERFEAAQVICLDASRCMLEGVQRRSAASNPLYPLCADLGALPLASRSVDLVYSNLAVYWSPDPPRTFAELRRVLKPDGMLLLSTFGTTSMKELVQAWYGERASEEGPAFADLLEIGDALVAAGFREPVMDTDRITLTYASPEALCADLEGTGSSLLFADWTERARRQGELAHDLAPIKVSGRYPLTFEIVYCIAFGPGEGQPRRTAEGEVATFSVDSLLKTRPERD